MSLPTVTFWNLLTGAAALFAECPTCGQIAMNPVYEEDVADYAGNVGTTNTGFDGWVLIAGPQTPPVALDSAGGYEYSQTLIAYGFLSTSFSREDGMQSLEYAALKAYEVQTKMMEPGSRTLGITTPGAKVKATEFYAPDGFGRVTYQETVVHLLPFQMTVLVRLC